MSAIPSQRNRRMTLSSLPIPSQRKANRRSSIDPGSSAAGNAGNGGVPKSTRRPPKGRVSMIPRVGRENSHNNIGSIPNTPGAKSISSTASSRRRSMAGNGDVKSKRRSSMAPSGGSVSGGTTSRSSDPRPINDKGFQHQCIKQLLSFLVERGYEYPVSAKSLSRPSAKDFTNITTFLLRRLDSNFGRSGGTFKFEDEVSLNFKCMGYPYPISKTALVAAGSPHTWPSLLAALTWLVHQLQCRDVLVPVNELDIHDHDSNGGSGSHSTPFESLPDLESQTDRAFFQYLGRAYMAFMRGDTEQTDALETALLARFERDDGFLEQAVERVTDVNASIVERLNELSQQAHELPTYTQKREDYATDLEQFHDLIRQMDEHKAALQQKVEERTAELSATNIKLDKMTTHINDLKESVKNQEFSIEDIHKMESELKGLTESSERANVTLEQKQQMLLSSEKELVAVTTDLDSMISDFNGILSDINVVPELAAQFAPFKAILNQEHLSQTNVAQTLSVDLNQVQSLTSSTKQEYVDKVDEAKAKYQDFLDNQNSAEDACKEAEAKHKIVGDKKAKCELTLESEQKTLDAKLSVRQREVEAMDRKIESLQDPVALEEQMATYERQCAELEVLRIEQQGDHAKRRNALLTEMNSACELMADHQSYVEQSVAKTQEYWRAKIAELPEVTPPTNMTLTPSASTP